jgi:hypothetical protein
MRLAFCLSLIVAIGSGPLLAATPSDKSLAHSVAELSGKNCYGIAAGTILMPTVADPDALNKSVKAIEGMGLSYGVNDSMMKGLARPGLTLISQATMGSKSFAQGEVVLAVGGRQPGCRVIVLSEPTVNITDAISAELSRAEWKAVPSMTAMRGGIERRAFFRRDGKGNPYLMNLMTITSPAPDSKLRLFTTTIRIPSGVQLPQGL